jgi:putative ABC transport system permease protein
METVDISIYKMLLLYLFLLIPAFLFWRLKMPLIQKMSISIVRMTVQLALIGLYLRYLFDWNSPWLNIGWLIVMIAVAAGHILKTSQISVVQYYPRVLLSVMAAMAIILIPFIGLIIAPSPVYDARYVIPLGGMMLGNFLDANIVALHHYTQTLRMRKQELQTAICFGATRWEAVFPVMKEAFHRSITPQITRIATLGLVSLPGMMTGQMLGGSFPLVAIKYQIAIMIAILSSASLSIYFTLRLVTPRLFSDRDNIVI